MPRHDVPGGRPSRRLARELAELDKRRGWFIVIERNEKASTQAYRKHLKSWLTGLGNDVISIRRTPPELIQPVVRMRRNLRKLDPREYCLIHAAGLRHRIETEILPALCSGKSILMDSYVFGALAEAEARGLDFNWVLGIYQPVLWPDAVLGTPANLGLAAPGYREFLSAVRRQYSALGLVFENEVTNGGSPKGQDPISVMHRHASRTSWADFNAPALASWLASRPEVSLG